MKRSSIILFLFLFCSAYVFSQTPTQLPSLFDDSYRTPTIEKNESPENIIRKSIFVKAVATEQSVYVGQPLLVTYKLYACIFCRSRVNRQPSFNGCSVTEIPYSGDAEIENINGKIFHVYTIRKVQVIPLEEGPLELGQAAIDNIVPFNNADNTPGNFSLTAVNEPLIINVKPLPEKDKPADFSGVVGNFSIATTVDSNNIPAGENTTLRITIKGNGNFAGIHLPGISWPKGTEYFEASDTQRIDESTYPIVGYKTFSIPFIASKEGVINIPPVSFNYFDPAENSYKSISSNPVSVVFTKAISNRQQLQNIVQEDVGNSKYLWIIGAIAITVVCVWTISNTIKNRKQKNSIQQVISAIPEKPTESKKEEGAEILSALNRLDSVEDDKNFLMGASYLLTTALQIKFESPNATSNELLGFLRLTEDNAEIANMCDKIYASCNRNLYSPDAVEGVKEDIYFELSAVIKKLYPMA